MAARHAAGVLFRKGARFPYQPTCSCGWLAWGYLTHDAAENVASEHERTADG